MGAVTGERCTPLKDYKENTRDSLVDLNVSDSTELWLMQFPPKLGIDFDGKEVTLHLHHEGKMGTVEGSSDDKDAIDGVDLDENEPTMAEKLAILDFSNNETTESKEKLVSHPAQPPSADSVHVLLKQAIHADDRSLLLDCLYNQDQRVVSNSVSLLSSSDTFKLLNSLLSIVQSRGAVVACALPWLRSLLLQHASKIMSQESSLAALNSLYQLIDSRVSNFSAAVQLASTLDSLYAEAAGDITDEDKAAAPAVYNDDESEDYESEDAMETDEEVEGSSNVSDVEGSMQMSD